MKIKCKQDGCTGHVTYIVKDTELVTAFRVALGDSMNDEVPHATYRTSVVNILLADKNKFNEVKTIYLTCDKIPSHTLGYQIPFVHKKS
jgi:hypothetical protein